MLLVIWLLYLYFCFSAHVLTEDTISREIRNGKLHSKRLLSKTNSLPKWGERFYSAKAVKIVEESVVDPTEKTLTTYTRNIAFTKVMVSHNMLSLDFNFVSIFNAFDDIDDIDSDFLIT